MRDLGEMLAADGDSEPGRAKCLYLSIAAAVGLTPGALLAPLKSRARESSRKSLSRSRVSWFWRLCCMHSSWLMICLSEIILKCERRSCGSVILCLLIL